jgi:hypothetical protein
MSFTVSAALAWLGKVFGTIFTLHEERCWDKENGAGMIVTCTILGQVFEVAFWRPASWKFDWLVSKISRVADRKEIFLAKQYLAPEVYRQFKLAVVGGELVLAVLSGKGARNLRLTQVFPLKDMLPQSAETMDRNSIIIADGELVLTGSDVKSLRALKLKTSKVLAVGYDLTGAEQDLERLEQAAEVQRRNEIAKAAADKLAAEETAKLARKAARDARRKELAARKWLTAFVVGSGERVFGCPLTAEEYEGHYHYAGDPGTLFLVVTGWNQAKAKAETAVRHFRHLKKAGVVTETEVQLSLSFKQPVKPAEKAVKVDRMISLVGGDGNKKFISAMVIDDPAVLDELKARGTNHGTVFVRSAVPDKDGRLPVYAFLQGGIKTIGTMRVAQPV